MLGYFASCELSNYLRKCSLYIHQQVFQFIVLFNSNKITSNPNHMMCTFMAFFLGGGWGGGKEGGNNPIETVLYEEL